MARATKVIIVFDDGTTFDVSAASASSIFLKETAAERCGHNPPYDPPPKADVGMLQPLTAVGGVSGGATTAAAEEGTACYMINGVIVCP